MPRFIYALAESGEVLDLDVYADIGEGSFWSDSVSAAQVRRQLHSSQAKTINLRIHSDGGDVFEAADMFDQLSAHPAKKVVRIGGLALSAASYLAMVGDEIVMGPNAWMMIHNPHGGVGGSAEKIRSWADVLDKARAQYAEAYAKRSGQTKEKVLELMAAETWLTAAEAVELGFADRVDAGAAAPSDAKAKARAQGCFAAASLRDFANTPPAVRELMTSARAALQPAATPEPQPAPVVRSEQQTPKNTGKESNMAESNHFVTAIAIALGLPVGAPESDVTAAVARIRDLEKEATLLTGAQSTAEALGALRGLKTKADRAEAAERELSTVKAERDKQNFDTLLIKGKSEGKLDTAHAKIYEDEFAAAAAEGRGAEVVARLKGHLPHMGARVPSRNVSPPLPSRGNDAVALKWNDKSFDELKPVERHDLKAQNPDLYDAMRRDWQESQ
jgi:ATP-dependent protease ClpP protease subunit